MDNVIEKNISLNVNGKENKQIKKDGAKNKEPHQKEGT